MRTKLFTIRDITIDQEKIIEASKLLANGELVAFPTETVYGLGADATNEAAVAGIFTAKGRPQDNPLIVHVASEAQCRELVEKIPEYVNVLMEKFSPGPITFVLPHKGGLARNVTAGLTTVGVRIPDHPLALALIEKSGCPIAAPSANTSGKPSPTQAWHVAADLDGQIAGIVDGGATGIGVESTVVDCTGEKPVILRPGGVTQEMIESVLGFELDQKKEMPEADKPKSPGMKYRHYAPELPLWLVEGNTESLQQLINDEQKKGKRIAVLARNEVANKLTASSILNLGEQPEEIAACLYDALRRYTKTDADLLICEAFSKQGIGEAIMNRLTKAADAYIVLDKN